MRRVLVVGLLVLALPGLATPGGDPDRFAKDLASIDALMKRERWSEARETLLELVTEHEGQSYVLKERASILERLKAATFHAEYERPEPETLIQGDLVEWREKSGKIRLRYAPDQFGDFQQHSNPQMRQILVHPLTFEGAYSVEVEVSCYGRGRTLPTVLVGFDTKEPAMALFGLKKGGRGNTVYWKEASVHFREGDDLEVAAEKKSVLEQDEPAKLKVSVKSGSVSVYGNGRKMVSASRKKGIYGQIALRDFGSIEKIEIWGTAQGSWFQGLRDKAYQEAMTEFEKGYRPEKLLPAWFFGEEVAAGGSDEAYGIPGPYRDGQTKLLKEALRRGEKSTYDALRWFLDKDKNETTEEFRLFVRVLLLNLGEEFDQALTLCEELGKLVPDHVDTQLLLATLYRRTGSREHGIRVLQALQSEHPQDPRVARHLARAMFDASRPDHARAVVEAAVDSGVHPRELEDIDRILIKIEDGPPWRESFEHATRNYVVRSDIDERVCYEASNLLEKSFTRFSRDLRRVSGASDRRYSVLLFSGREGYQEFCEDVVGSRLEFSAGCYSPITKQLLIWNVPDRDAMFRVIRHEGFHQYFDRLVGPSPRWLNEGLAEYYEDIELVGGRWRQGEPRRDHLETLAREGPRKVEEFLRISDAKFMGDIARSYAQSWATVHFLRHERKYTDVFERLIDLLMTNLPVRDALDKALADVDMKGIEEDFVRHLAELQASSR